jgi:hypothetical protein
MTVSAAASKIYQAAKKAASGIWAWRSEWSKAMKKAWKKNMSGIQIVDSYTTGATTTTIITGITEEQAWDYGLAAYDTDAGVKISTTNKKEASIINLMMETIAHSQPRNITGKYIELTLVTEQNELKRGREWYASPKNIRENNLPECWNGELVCYVYNVKKEK